jgi:nitronate monooxygenase
MRALAQKEGELQRMQAWAGQSAALAKAEPAANVLTQIWEQAQALLP